MNKQQKSPNEIINVGPNNYMVVIVSRDTLDKNEWAVTQFNLNKLISRAYPNSRLEAHLIDLS